VAKLRTYDALIAIRAYLTTQIPVQMTAIGQTSRIEDWYIGRQDPLTLPHYDAGMIVTIPERVGPLTAEQTVRSFLDILFAVRGSTEDEVIGRQLGYGDAVVNTVEADRTLGGAVFECTAFNPESEMPAPGAKQTGITVVRLQIELNLLGG
jgi:hypothetical protein